MYRVGDFVDVQDHNGQWYHGILVDMTDIHYQVYFVGFNKKWNEKIQIHSSRICPFQSRYKMTSQLEDLHILNARSDLDDDEDIESQVDHHLDLVEQKENAERKKPSDSRYNISMNHKNNGIATLLEENCPIPKDVSIIIRSSHFPNEPLIIHAHSVILAAQSDYFQSVLFGVGSLKYDSLADQDEWKTKHRPVVLDWDYTDPQVIKRFFQLFYLSSKDWAMDFTQVMDYASLADYLQFSGLETIVNNPDWKRYLFSIGKRHAAGFLQLCSFWQVSALKSSVEEIVVTELSHHADTYLDIAPLDMIKEYIDRPMDRTKWVQALLGWYKRQTQLTFDQFKDLIRPISWHLVNPTLLVDEIEPLGLVDPEMILQVFRRRFSRAAVFNDDPSVEELD